MTQRNRRNVLPVRRGFKARGEQLDSRFLLSGITVVVNTTNDFAAFGPTLRAAITLIDSSGDPTSPNSIVFQIPKADPGYNPANGTFTIRVLQQELPPITKPAFIDGTTESTFLGEPALVVIDGGELKAANGLTVGPRAPGTTIDDLEITNFDESGIVIESSNNTIGGTAADAGNILVSNATAGVSIAPNPLAPGQGSSNQLLGNFIGTNPAGADLGNGIGIIVGTPNNTIGGLTSGAANVIGFNKLDGVQITGATATHNLLLGNWIGTDASGNNLGNPIGVDLESALNTIGGTASGAGNVFGFDTAVGLQITAAGATNESVLGNLFGTNASGDNLGNPIGVLLQTGSNTIGGTTTGAGNVFGFNTTAGLQIAGVSAINEAVFGNLFGTNATGASVGNVVGLLLQSASNTIGGTTTGAANVFGFNTTAGLQIAGVSAINEAVLGNLFGTNASGANVGNVIGLLVQADSNTIGGTTTGAANVFGFNGSAGVEISGTGATGNVLLGNFVGTNTGGANLGNAVGVDIGSGGNTVGGTTPAAANVISFNSTAGVQITGTAAAGNALIGNLIGTDASGQIALGNGIGVLVTGGTANVIGATTAGAGNVISGNFTAGIELNGSSVSGTQIVGNRIGTDPTGTRAVTRTDESTPLQALQNAGVVIIGSAGNTVGGTTVQAANLISGNYVGVMLATITGQVSPNQVMGNLIGTDASGSNPLGNIVGIYINGASGNQVGGTGPGSGNTISGNTSVGIEIYGSGSTANLIQGNMIGLAANGQAALRKKNGLFIQPTGVFILNASGNVIGGATTGSENVISGNESAGVYIVSRSGVSGGNVVEGNLIGLSSGGFRRPGNDGYGVLFLNSPNNQVQLTRAAANRFGRNGIANFRKVSGSATASPSLAVKHRRQGVTSTKRSR